MKLLSTLRHVVAFSALLVPLSAFSETGKAPAYNKISEFFGAGLRGENIARQAYITGISNYLRQNGMTSNKLTKEDIDTVKRRALAYMRMKRVSLILVADMDGDGNVTKSEMAEYLNMPGAFMFVDDPRIISPLVNTISNQPPTPQEYVIDRLDKNKDGKVSYDEMRYIPDEQQVFRGKDADSMRVKLLTGLMEQDPDEDGKLTLAELETLAGQAFDIVDLNKDGILQRDEFNAYHKATAPAPAAKVKP